MRILVVVLNWNGVDDTEQCLAALTRQTMPADVLVVDNGSCLDDVSRLGRRAKAGTVRLHLESKNIGFAGGVNIGIRLAQRENYDAVALLNNDATPQPDWLEALAGAIDGASIATGLLLHRTDDVTGPSAIDTAGDGLSLWGMPFPRHRGQPRACAPSAGEVFSASGGASLYRTALFDDIGLFDEKFFAYFEDVDIGFRARLAGHRIVYTPTAIAHHRIGATSKRIPGFTVRQTFKNLPVLLLKNVPKGLRYPIWSRFVLLYAMMFGKCVIKGTGRYALTGLSEAIRLVPYALRERRLIQASVNTDVKRLLFYDLPPGQHGMRRLLRCLRATV